MTPYEKSNQLIKGFQDHADTDPDWLEQTKNCALVCVDEILNSCKNSMYPEMQHPMAGYWEQVKEEIKKQKYTTMS